MLDKGKDLDWFSSPVIVVLGVVAVIAFAFFRDLGADGQEPGRRSCGSSPDAISSAGRLRFRSRMPCSSRNLVLLPQWMQQYLNYRSVDAGLVTAPLGIFAVILAPVMGKIMPQPTRA